MPSEINPINFTFVNADGKAILYRTDDISLNKFTLTIFNATKGPLTLSAGSPNKLEIATEATTFNVSFTTILTEERARNLDITLPSDDWAADFIVATIEEAAFWSIYPTKNTVIPAGTYLAINFANINGSVASPGLVEYGYKNIPNYSDPIFAESLYLPVIKKSTNNPPSLDWTVSNVVHPIQHSGMQDYDTDSETDTNDGKLIEGVPIYITYAPSAPIKNGFTFNLTNDSDQPLVPPTPPPVDHDHHVGDPDKPTLYINFLLGDAPYDITTKGLGNSNIRIDVDSKLLWKQQTSKPGEWIFTAENKKIIDARETVKFIIHNIITDTNTEADTLSYMHVQLINITGYDDVAYRVPMRKIKAEATVSIQADKEVIKLGENITLQWTSTLAKRVTLTYYDHNDVAIVLDSALGQIKLSDNHFVLEHPTNEDTDVTIAAYDDRPRPVKAQYSFTVTQVNPKIKSFTSSAPLIESSENTQVTLNWDVENYKNVEIETPTGTKIFWGAVNTYTCAVNSSFRFALSANSYNTNLPTDVRTLDILGYERATVSVPLADQAQQPTSVLISHQFGRAYVLSSNLVYEIDLSTLAVIQTFAGQYIALSPNGSKLFISVWTADRLESKVIMYDLLTGKRDERITMTKTKQIIVNDAIDKIVLLGEAFEEYKHCFVLVLDIDPITTQFVKVHFYNVTNLVKSAVSFNTNQTGFYVSFPIFAHLSWYPFDGSGSHTGIPLPEKTPSNLVLNKSAARLYIVCKVQNVIIVFDTRTNVVINEIGLESQIGDVIISPNDKFLYVANPVRKTISVISTLNDQVISTIALAFTPLTLAVDLPTDRLFVTSYCDKVVTVIDLKTNVALTPYLSTGNKSGNPLDMALYNNGQGETKLFVSKEYYSTAGLCPASANDNLNTSVFKITNLAKPPVALEVGNLTNQVKTD